MSSNPVHAVLLNYYLNSPHYYVTPTDPDRVTGMPKNWRCCLFTMDEKHPMFRFFRLSRESVSTPYRRLVSLADIKDQGERASYGQTDAPTCAPKKDYVGYETYILPNEIVVF